MAAVFSVKQSGMGRGFVLCAAILLGGCSPLSLLNATVSSDGYTSIENVSYGDKDRQSLDIHIPVEVKANADVVLFYYGGRWQSGDKSQYRFVADAYTSKGFITVLPDYRVYPEVDWRDILRDGADAYAWTQGNIRRYGGNPERIFVAGHSAGAHIAAMVAVNDELNGKKSNQPCGLIGLAGPYDFLPIDQQDIKQVFASADDLNTTQPITYAGKDEPAMLLMHGVDDTTVKPGNSERFANKVGEQATLKYYEGVDHVDILLALSSTFRNKSTALSDSTGFINSVDCQ